MTKRELCNQLLEICEDADLYLYPHRDIDKDTTEETLQRVLSILVKILIQLSDHYYDMEKPGSREIHFTEEMLQ